MTYSFYSQRAIDSTTTDEEKQIKLIQDRAYTFLLTQCDNIASHISSISSTSRHQVSQAKIKSILPDAIEDRFSSIKAAWEGRNGMSIIDNPKQYLINVIENYYHSQFIDNINPF